MSMTGIGLSGGRAIIDRAISRIASQVDELAIHSNTLASVTVHTPFFPLNLAKRLS